MIFTITLTQRKRGNQATKKKARYIAQVSNTCLERDYRSTEVLWVGGKVLYRATTIQHHTQKKQGGRNTCCNIMSLIKPDASWCMPSIRKVETESKHTHTHTYTPVHCHRYVLLRAKQKPHDGYKTWQYYYYLFFQHPALPTTATQKMPILFTSGVNPYGTWAR